MTQISLPGNEEIANMLNEIAHLLELQHADQFRIMAYQKAANLVLQSDREMAKILASGNGDQIEEIHGIGEGISRLIIEYLKTGKCKMLNRLRGAVNPEDLFEDLPGIGHDLAKRIVDTLHLHSLEELEQAAHDGRLDTVEGFGEKRVEAMKMILAGKLIGFPRQQVAIEIPKIKDNKPTVALLLKIDERYRKKAKEGKLKKIAPRRFNPENKAWLPIMHSHMDDWSFTVLFSNTWRAHELKKTKDWVIVFFEKGIVDGQATIVTESTGALKGKRVIRGREGECTEYYKKMKSEAKMQGFQVSD